MIRRRLSACYSSQFSCARPITASGRNNSNGPCGFSGWNESGPRLYSSRSKESTELGQETRDESSSSSTSPGHSTDDRDFYLSILTASSTKREAKPYLQRFDPSKTPAADVKGSLTTQIPALPPLANPASLAQYLRAVPQPTIDFKSRARAYLQRLLTHQQKYTPTQFAVSAATEWFTPEITEAQVHVALVKIRQIQSIEDEVLCGIARTLVKLNRLGLVAAVVIDPGNFELCKETSYGGTNGWLEEQAERIVAAVERQKGHARSVHGACSVTVHQDEGVTISLPNLLITPLARRIIPVIFPVAYDNQQQATIVKADSVILALTRLLSIDHQTSDPEGEEPRLFSLHRIIFLDPLGGIPSRERPHNTAHVFLNLEQEFEAVKEELRAPLNSSIASPPPAEDNIHVQNLITLRRALALLPPTSSALITTPVTAATSASTSGIVSPSSVGTPSETKISARRPTPARNPLIYNLLTDKPVFSSSLPINDAVPCTNTTLLKHGIPLSIYTNPTCPQKNNNNENTFTLKDATIDLGKLTYLIEDSFGRVLNVDAYLSRVNDRMAGLIIAGDYEGAAIITWEDGRISGNKPERQWVPYLDKFAVLRRSQGAGGVADVIFKAMVIGLYPGGLVWRSRSNNPVNKWYFERAKGSWKLPGTIWTMFWTGDGDKIDRERFEQYVDICKTIEPSFKP